MKKMNMENKKEDVYRFRISEQKYRLIMIVGLYIAIIVFILAIIALAKNIEEIKTDPIIYGMDKHNFNSCTCYSDGVAPVNIQLKDFKPGEG